LVELPCAPRNPLWSQATKRPRRRARVLSDRSED
jgi:hypothetical protein